MVRRRYRGKGTRGPDRSKSNRALLNLQKRSVSVVISLMSKRWLLYCMPRSKIGREKTTSASSLGCASPSRVYNPVFAESKTPEKNKTKLKRKKSIKIRI